MARERHSATIREITRRYYSVWWMYSFANGFLFGVYPLFLRSRGLSQFEINSVLAVYFAVTFLTDVPTGAFADAIGRRNSFLAGCALRTAAFCLYFFAHTYWVFLIAESIDGIGTTFGNGAIDAWGVDQLDAAGFEGLKDGLFSRVSQLTNLGFMLAALAGAYVADVNIALPWLLGAAGFTISAVVGGRLMRGEPAHVEEFKLANLPAQVADRMSAGVRQGFSSRAVLLLSLSGAIQVAAWAPYWLEWPQFFVDSYRVGVFVIGWVYGGLTIGRMIGAEVISRWGVSENSRPGVLGSLVLMASATLFAAGLVGARPTLVLALLFVMNLATGAMQPLMQSWFNEQIEAGQRATLLSFSSTMATFGGSIGLLLSGMVADAMGLSVAWQLAGVLSLAAAPCYWALRRGAAAPVTARAPVGTGGA